MLLPHHAKVHETWHGWYVFLPTADGGGALYVSRMTAAEVSAYVGWDKTR